MRIESITKDEGERTMSVARKAVLVGLDSAGSRLTEEFINRGLLPNLKRIKDNGVYMRAICPFPTITPPNWATIATGTWPGTHGITDFYTHHPGEPLDKIVWGSGFNSRECQVEFIWEMVAKEGGRSILVNYPASWPPRTKDVWQILGCGLGRENEFKLNMGQLFTTDDRPFVTTIELKPATQWKGLDAANDCKEAELTFEYPGVEAKIYYLLAGENLSLHESRDASAVVAKLPLEGWSEWIRGDFPTEKGTVPGAFRLKTVTYDRGSGELSIFLPEVFPTKGFTEPPELCEELINEFGPYIEEAGWVPRNEGLATDEEFLELMEYQNNWYSSAVPYLMKNKEWKLLYLHAHGIDHAQHAFLRNLDDSKDNEDKLIRAYQSADALVGSVYDAIDEDTLFIVVSDHGATSGGKDDIDMFEILKEGGFLAYDEPFPGLREIDWATTRAVPNRSTYIYVNLEGRDPNGCVKKTDYESTRDEIVRYLRKYRHPQSGESPFAFLMTREEARVIGLRGDGTGDIVYSTYPEYSSEHGRQHAAAQKNRTSIESLLILSGPGMKKGCNSDANVFLTDVVPTICHLTDIPVPPKCEGGIVYDALEDPNFGLTAAKKLSRDRAALERAIKEYKRLSHS